MKDGKQLLEHITNVLNIFEEPVWCHIFEEDTFLIPLINIKSLLENNTKKNDKRTTVITVICLSIFEVFNTRTLNFGAISRLNQMQKHH